MFLTSMITSVHGVMVVHDTVVTCNTKLPNCFESIATGSLGNASTLQGLDNLYSAAGGMTPSFGILQQTAY